MEKVYETTGDKNFNIILIDFNSTDIDVEKELKKANLPRYNLHSSKQSVLRGVDDQPHYAFIIVFA